MYCNTIYTLVVVGDDDWRVMCKAQNTNTGRRDDDELSRRPH